MPALSLDEGDLGFSTDRGRGILNFGATATSLLLADLVRMKFEGLMKRGASCEELSLFPLRRLAENVGSTFSESSMSTVSAAFRLDEDGDEDAMPGQPHVPIE